MEARNQRVVGHANRAPGIVGTLITATATAVIAALILIGGASWTLLVLLGGWLVGIAYSVRLLFRRFVVDGEGIEEWLPMRCRRIRWDELTEVRWASGKQSGWVEFWSDRYRIRLLEGWYTNLSEVAAAILDRLSDDKRATEALVALRRFART